MKYLIIILISIISLSGYAQIAGGKKFLSGPGGFIKNVKQMETSPENLQKGQPRTVDQFFKNEEDPEEEREEAERLYNQPNPMRANASVSYLSNNNYNSPATPTAEAKLTAQHPGITGTGNQYVNLDPSDAQIAAGPNHTVVLANGNARILDKRTGAIISQVTLPAFFSWSGFVFDPRIMYDPYGQRWVALALQNAKCNPTVDSKFRVLISNNSDPTQGWFWYEFDVDANNIGWLDFAKLGFNKDWICISGNVRCANVPGLYVLPRTAAYAAGSISYNYWNAIELGTPAFTFDMSLDRLYIVRTGSANTGGTGYVDSWYINSTPQLFNGSSYGTSPWQAFATDSTKCPKQLGGQTFTGVNVFGHAMYSNCVYRNGSLWFAHPVFLPATGTTNRVSTQWWQVNPSTGAVQQVGRIDDGSGSTSTFYPSIGVNKLSDVVVTYSIFNASYYQSAAYNFRSSADGSGSLPNGVFYSSGNGVDFDGRGGDYSQCAVDPLDDQSIWVVNQVPTSSWDTRYALIAGYYGCTVDANFGNNSWTGYTKNEASNSITSAEMIQSPSVVDYDAGAYITLTTGFVASEGCWFSAYIEGCGNYRTGNYKPENPVFTDMSKDIISEANKELSLFPNPAKNYVNINYSLKIESNVAILIYSAEMKLIKQIEYRKKAIGKHTEEIDTRQLNSGVYFVKIQRGNDLQTRKIVIAR